MCFSSLVEIQFIFEHLHIGGGGSDGGGGGVPNTPIYLLNIICKLWQNWENFDFFSISQGGAVSNLIDPNSRDPLVALYWIAEKKIAAGPRWEDGS